LFSEPLNPDFPTSYGFYRSTNGGASWTQNNSGLPDDESQRDRHGGAKSNASLVYLGHPARRIFKSGDGGDHWDQFVFGPADAGPFPIAVSRSIRMWFTSGQGPTEFSNPPTRRKLDAESGRNPHQRRGAVQNYSSRCGASGELQYHLMPAIGCSGVYQTTNAGASGT